MIEQGKSERLEEFGDALEDAGYEVLEAEPKLDRTITEKVDQQHDDTVGFVVVRTPVELGGREFEGEIVVIVHETHLSNHGVDVFSDPDDPFTEEEREHLSQLVPPREVTTEDGKTRQAWSYYPPPADLPDEVVDDDRDNLDELLAEFESIYESVPDQ